MRACQTLHSLTGPWGIYPACPPSALLPLSGETEADVLCVFVGGGGLSSWTLHSTSEKSLLCILRGREWLPRNGGAPRNGPSN